MSVFLKQFDSFYITENHQIVIRYKIDHETYFNYIIGELNDYKNRIIKPKKNLDSLDTFPLETHI
jgi:hypothetical protein